MLRFNHARTAVVALVSLTLIACDDDSPTEVELLDIVETAQAAGAFNTLLAALDAADLTATLQGEGPFTVFAPTDDAFAALPDGVVDALLADTQLLTRVLTYHVVAGSVPSATVVGLSSAETLNGKSVTVTVMDGEVMLDGATVLTPDVEASNGIIHIIDDVLLPEIVMNIVQTASKAGGFSTLLAALDAAGLTATLEGEGPFTVFAPTDEAFAALPAGTLDALLAAPEDLAAILTYHVVAGAVFSEQVVNLTSAATVNGASVTIDVDGTTVRIDDANVLQVDIEATNGVIHVIDRVILPS